MYVYSKERNNYVLLNIHTVTSINHSKVSKKRWGDLLRSTRLRKFRKKYQPLIICFKAVIVLYMVIFSASYVTTDTVAYFDDTNVSAVTITAGTWEDEQDKDEKENVKDEVKEELEDRSSLAFVDQEATASETCPAHMEVEVTNTGDGPMRTKGFYEVYYVEDGHPEDDGEKLSMEDHEGTLEILKEEDTKKLAYETSTSGFYQFVIFQDEDASEKDRVWSEVIEVVCEEEESEESEDETEQVEEDQREDKASEESVKDEESAEENNKDYNEENTSEKNAESTKDEEAIEEVVEGENDEEKEGDEVVQ